MVRRFGLHITAAKGTKGMSEMVKTTGRLVDMIRKDDPIVKYGDPVLGQALRQISKKVTQFPDDMPEFVERMEEIMDAAHGVGLAAPQLGILERVIVYDVGEGWRAIVNPQIVRSSGEQMEPPEGCLSLPGLQGIVKRYNEIVVKGLDQFEKPIRLRVDGYASRVIQHEVDHLDGILFIDRAEKETLHWVTAEEMDEEEEKGTAAMARE
jgi:peptide deformylase